VKEGLVEPEVETHRHVYKENISPFSRVLALEKAIGA
jgi:hypothetical protein